MGTELGPPTGAHPLGPSPAATAERVPTLTPGTELLGPAAGDDERYLARRHDGQVVRMPWLLHRISSLADGERDLAAIADLIGAEDDHVITVEEVRLVLDRRLVPAGLVSVPDGDPSPPARVARRRAPRVLALVLAALALVAATAAVTTVVVLPAAAPAVDGPVGPATNADEGGVTAPQGLDGPPTLLGLVVEVPDTARAVVDVDGRRLGVEVAGLVPDGTPSCVVDEARAFARSTLIGQEVALVPDPSLPPTPGDRYRAYLVLPSQLSYTDAVLRAGWARAGEGRYRAGFVDAEDGAREAGAGLWGSPCSPQT